MIYFLRTILIILTSIFVFKGIRIFNKKIENKILNDVYKHFESEQLTIQNVSSISKNSKEIPFNINEWTPSTGMHSKNYYANRFWKVEIIDDQNLIIIKWVNTGHIFFYKMYIIVKSNEIENKNASA